MYPVLLGSGALTLGDLSTLEIYCSAYARWRKAEAKLTEQDGLWLVKTPNDHVQASPWIAIANRAAEIAKSYLTELGMTPASRTRMGVDDGESPRVGARRPVMGGKFAQYIGRE